MKRGRTSSSPVGKRRRRRGAPGWLDALDALQERCENIETLTGLLEACGGEPLEPRLVQRAGGLIDRELVQIRKLLEAWWQKEAR